MRVKPIFMCPSGRSTFPRYLFVLLSALGCATAPNLSVQLVNPKTNAMRTCAARASTSKDIPILTDAVEACARQLEARGFIRMGKPFTPDE